MSETDDPTEPVDAVEEPDVAAEPTPAGDDPVRTVTRKGATLGIAGALVLGGIVGWAGATAFDDDGVPISAFQDGGGGPGGPGGHEGGRPGGPMGGGGPGPMGGFGGPPGGPGGGFPGEGGPPWMDEGPGGDREDDGEDQDDEDRDDEDESAPSTTEGDA